MATVADDPQGKLRLLTDEYTKLQQEQQKLVVSQQRLNAQKTENEGVKQVGSLFQFLISICASSRLTMQEFEKLKDGETIYKLIGPVLLKQDKLEANSTVKGRLDFIDKEIDRLEGEIKESNDKMDAIKDQIMATQTSAQPAQ
ncbi:Prefoldin subunit 6 [Sporothrix epigloea]|uniref:Prefoldin subunit 6 n=1 Tax=Sporothrix epigloea TaxID=1892477 RepID=A0ABP0DWZ4_9PEZI